MTCASTGFRTVVLLVLVGLASGCISPAVAAEPRSIEGLWWDISRSGAPSAGKEVPARVFRFCGGGKVLFSSMMVENANGEFVLGPGRVWLGTWSINGSLCRIQYRYTSPAPIESNCVPLGTEEQTQLAIDSGAEALDGVMGHYTRIPKVMRSTLAHLYCDESELKRWLCPAPSRVEVRQGE